MHRFAFFLLAAAGPLAAQPISETDVYRYELEMNADAKLCGQMAKVYNSAFRQPWQRGKAKAAAFARIKGVARSEALEPQLFYSAHPSSAEFAAVKWQEGRSFYSGSSSPQAATLVAEFDIDNDGTRDVVVKTQFMRSAVAAAGSDQLWVLRRKSADPSKPLDMNRVFGKAKEEGVRQISSVTLHYTDKDRPAEISGERMAASLIRPVVVNGKAYLAVYVPWAVDDPKQRREWMWLMAYRGGGGSLGPGKWEPAKVDKLCRFRMAPQHRAN
jgi:hypothetical protein